jgi:DNA-directed RNA polymerase specialized sigma24 family protein
MAVDEGATEVVRSVLRTRAEADALVLAVLRDHAESLLRVARRHSLCADDAQDAYQRACEIFLRHAPTLEAAEAFKWMHTVTKHEAMRLRAQRARTVGGDDVDFDHHQAGRLPTADEQVASFDLLTRSAEALQRLKPQELRALWLKAQGHSYAEIAELEGWTYTKVNRCITEGRRSFLDRYAEIASGGECRRWEPVLSAMADGEASARDLAAVRPHLRHCPACRAHVAELRASTRRVAALLPVPVAAAAADPGGLLARIHDAIFGHVQERVVLTATKLQSGVEAALPAKLAVVAASAAAIGGGVAVERAVTDPERPAAAKPARTSAAASPSPVAREPEVPRGAPVKAAPAPRAPKRVVARRTTKTEFGISHDAKASSSDSTAAREFSSTSSSAPAATASSSPATVTPIKAPPHATSAERTAAAEFGG